MARSFSLLLALRYLKPKRTFVSVITLISVLGVSLGVAVLIVVISVMKGFELKIKELMLGFEPHIVLVDRTRNMNADALEAPPSAPVTPEQGDSMPTSLAPLPGEGAAAKASDPTKDQDAVPSPAEPPAPESAKPALVPPSVAAGKEDEMVLEPVVDTQNWREVMKALRQDSNVVSASPFMEGPVFMEFHSEPQAVFMRAVLADDSADYKKIQALQLDKSQDVPQEIILDSETAVLGQALADQTHVRAGDTITLYSPQNVKDLVRRVREIEKDKDAKGDPKVFDSLKQLILPVDLQVEAVFKNDRYSNIMLLPLHIAQAIYHAGDNVNGLAITVKDPYVADQVVRELYEKGLVPPGWDAQAWMELPQNKDKLMAVSNERGMMYFVLFIIVVVAAFCVMNTMITVTVQKRREIGVITALGARVSQIVWIFVSQGIVVGILGTALGAALGSLIVVYREWVQKGIEGVIRRPIFPADIYGLSAIPAKLEAVDMIVICAGAFSLSTLAALIPAYMAARVDPARALRNE